MGAIFSVQLADTSPLRPFSDVASSCFEQSLPPAWFAFRGSDSTELNIQVWPRSSDLRKGTTRLSCTEVKTNAVRVRNSREGMKEQRDHFSDGRRGSNPLEDLRVNF